MAKDPSFRTHLLLSFLICLVLSLLVPSWYYYGSLTDEIVTEAQSDVVHDLKIIQWMYEDHPDFATIDELQNWMTRLGQEFDLRITIVAEDGRVVADTNVPPSEVHQLEDFSARPEISQSLKGGLGLIIRFSRVMQQDHIYAAKKITAKGAAPAGVIRISAPYSLVSLYLNRVRSSFIFVIIFIFVVMMLLSFYLVYRIRSQMKSAIEVIRGISMGETRRRLRLEPFNEFYPLGEAVNEMAATIDARFRAVTDSKRQLDMVFDSMQEGVMVLNPQGLIVSTNRAMATLLPSPTDPIHRRPLEIIMSLELQAACDRLLTSRTTRPGDVVSLQMSLGSERSYDVHIGALAGHGKGGGAVVVFHDISELKRLEKVRQDFVANVSHELRTPLTSIKGYAETLLSDNEPDSQTLTSFLQVILKNANHMVKMVDDLLQLARLEGKSDPPQFVPVDAVDALNAAWKACLPMADAKSIKLVNTLPSAGVNVVADQDQIVQVFLNLIENGIKYSPEGETLQVSHRVDGGMVTFSVRDNGPGIPKHHQKRIFERFYRVEKHRGSTSGSTGLGLAICRHIIQNHGGSISVQSPNPDSLKGSTFHFTMRAADGPPQHPTAEAEDAENA